MSDTVEVPFGDDPSKTATLLLASAEKVEGDQTVVQTSTDGVVPSFIVPKKVAEDAGFGKKSPAKKAAAKKK